MAENQEKKTNRELFNERLKTRYPDREFADDEVLFGQIGEDYDDYERRIGEYTDREKKMEEMLQRDPRSAQFISDLANGKDPWIAVVEQIGSDGVIELINDPAKKEAMDEANRIRAERMAKEQELEAEYEKNLAESQVLREQLDEQYGEETVDAAIAVIDQMCKDAIMGKITKEAFEMALKVVNREADIENARSEGELAGRNAKIEEKLRKQTGGDGMPAMGGSSAAPAVPKKKGFFDDIPQRKF